MKLKFLKILTMSLVLGFLLPSLHASAMDNIVEVREDQNVQYAISLFTDMVLKNQQFKELYLNLQNAPLTEDVSDIVRKMQVHYDSYCQQCNQERVNPFIPTDPRFNFLAPQTPLFIGGHPEAFSVKTELRKLGIKNKGAFLFPSVEPVQIYELILAVLHPKYSNIFSTTWAKAESDLPAEEQAEVERFLHSADNDISVLIEDNIILAAFSLLTPLPDMGFHPTMMDPAIQSRFNQLSAWRFCPWLLRQPKYQPNWYGEFKHHRGCLFLEECGRIKGSKSDGVLKTYFEKLYKRLSMLVPSSGMDNHTYHMMYNQPTPEETQAKTRILKEITEALNKTFSFSGRQLFDVASDGKVLDKQIPQWFHVLRQLTRFEHREWKKKAPLVEQFLRQHKMVCDFLENTDDDTAYCGVSVGAFCISLTQTTKENGLDRVILKKFVDEHYNAHKNDIKRYEVVKPHLSTMKATLDWIDDVFKFIKKNGKIT